MITCFKCNTSSMLLCDFQCLPNPLQVCYFNYHTKNSYEKDKTNPDQIKKDDRSASGQQAEHAGEQGSDPREDQLGENAGGNFGTENSEERDDQNEHTRSAPKQQRGRQPSMESGEHEHSKNERAQDDESGNR